MPELPYEDGLSHIYFYTKGTKGGTEAIRALLNYFQDSHAANATNEDLRQIHEYVSKVRVLPEVRDEFMLFGEYIDYERKDAAKEAIHSGRVEDIRMFLEEHGVLSDTLLQKLEEEKNPEILRKWLKLAAKAESLEEFEKQITEAAL